MKDLKPSLDGIEARLTQPSDSLAWRIAVDEATVPTNLRREALNDQSFACLVADIKDHTKAPQDTSPPSEWQPPPMRQDLLARIQNTSALPPRKGGRLLAPGDVVAIFSLPSIDSSDELDLNAPALVLLDGNAVSEDGTVLNDFWNGWLVAAETDYATCWDAVVCEDETIENWTMDLGMVQVWNPLRVWLPSSGDHGVAAKLKPTALQHVRAIADEYAFAPESEMPAPDPGSIGLRMTAGGLLVLTGTLLSGPTDPRWRYQELYGAFAECLGTVARAAAARALASESRSAWSEILGALKGWLSPGPPTLVLPLASHTIAHAQTPTRRFRFELTEHDRATVELHPGPDAHVTISCDVAGDPRRFAVVLLDASSHEPVDWPAVALAARRQEVRMPQHTDIDGVIPAIALKPTSNLL